MVINGTIEAHFKTPLPKECLLDDKHFMTGAHFKLFFTEYGIGPGTYCGQIEARTWTHAEQLALARGLNERVIGELVEDDPDPKLCLLKYIEEKNWTGALHEAVFLGFVGLSSGALTPREVLGDEGLVHEITHILNFGEAVESEDIIATVTLSDGDPVSAYLGPELTAQIHEDDDKAAKVRLERIKNLAIEFMCRVPGWPTAIYEERGRAALKLKCLCPNCVEEIEDAD